MLWGAVWHGGRSELVLFDTSQSTGKRGGVTAAIYRNQITRGGSQTSKSASHQCLEGLWASQAT